MFEGVGWVFNPPLPEGQNKKTKSKDRNCR